MKGAISQKHLLKLIVVLVVFCTTLLMISVIPMTAFGLNEGETEAVEEQATAEDNAVRQSDTDTEDFIVLKEDGTEVYPTTEDAYIRRDEEYLTKTFPKYDPTAKDRMRPHSFWLVGGGYYENALVFLTIPGLEDVIINDILTDIDVVAIVSVYGSKAEGLAVELFFENSLQENYITGYLDTDSRVAMVDRLTFSAVSDVPDQILPVIERDEEYLTKTFPKYDPTARDRIIGIIAPDGEVHYKNWILLLAIPGVDDATINDILADFDTVKIMSVDGSKSRGLIVSLLLEDESQKESITERLRTDLRVIVGEPPTTVVVFPPDDPDETSPSPDSSVQDPSTPLPRTGDESLSLLGIIAVLTLSCGSLFAAAYRSHRRNY
jgi:hypothetical protein